MNKLKTGMGLCLILGWVTVAGAEIPAQKPMGKNDGKNISVRQKNEAATIAEKFINDYIKGRVDEKHWLSLPVTENFRKTYRERRRALQLAEQSLENKKLSKSERKLLNQYRGIEYDALLGAAVLDVSPEHCDFKVKSWNGKTGIMVLRDNVKPEFAVHADGKPVNIEVKLRLIKSKGKWLIDGVGNGI